MRTNLHTAATVAAVAIMAAACGAAAASGTGDDGAAPPLAGMCVPDVPDCVDTLVTGTDVGDDRGEGELGEDAPLVDEARQRANDLLGLDEASLDDDVRVGRRGDEWIALTEDYVIGRVTVELDDAEEGQFRVVSVTVELPDGPEVIAQ